MKSSEVKIGTTYRVKVSGTVQDVRITGENPHGGWDGVNVATKRTVRIKGVQRLRAVAGAKPAADGTVGSGLVLGRVYSAKSDGTYVPVRIESRVGKDGYRGVNMLTGKAIRIRRDDIRGGGQTPEQYEATRQTAVKNVAVVEKLALKDAAKAASKVLGVPVGVVDKDKKAAKAPGKKAARADGKKRPSGLDAAVAVLAEAGKPLNTTDMVKRMLETGLWATGGKTPAATIYAAIIREIAVKGAASRFRKVERGLFELTAAGKEVK